MLFNKKTLINLILYHRRKMDLPTDRQMMEFMNESQEHELKEIWEGLKELVRIFHNLGQRTFAYSQF